MELVSALKMFFLSEGRMYLALFQGNPLNYMSHGDGARQQNLAPLWVYNSQHMHYALR